MTDLTRRTMNSDRIEGVSGGCGGPHLTKLQIHATAIIACAHDRVVPRLFGDGMVMVCPCWSAPIWTREGER